MTAGKRHGRRFRSSHLLHLRSGLTSPRLVPFMFSVSGDSGLQAPCPSPGPSRKWLCQLLSGGPGEEGRDRDSEKTGNQGPTEPLGRHPSPGHPPASPQRRKATSVLSGIRFSGLGPQAGGVSGAPGGAAGTWRLVADSFLHSHSPSLSPAPRGPDSTRCPVKGAHAGPARRPNDPPRGRSRRPDTQKLLETESQPLLKCGSGWVVRALGL